MNDKETARQNVAAVVERFRNTPQREREHYNEHQTRQSFILPLFRALGWNIEDPSEVSTEEQISRGFVDYGFYLNGVPAFYLETKRVREDITKPEHMKQAINYAYLKGVTWAVLTDFEEMMVFNAEWEERDPEQARFLSLQWEGYTNGGFDDLWLLSKPSLQAREMDAKAERYGRKRRKEPVTDKLFKQLTEWRRELFSVIQHYNQDKLWAQDPHEIDNAVQKFIDRLIFIRAAEDRGIETQLLHALLRQSKPGDLWKNLLALFRELDGVYNSNLFAQAYLDLMDVYDPDLLKEIMDGLYAPAGSYFRYDFNAITADVLGAVYEQYLGFKALDPEGKTSLAGKQQKRKAQGIYYTPQLVVRYIVQNTVGKLLQEGADPHQLRILDPACGSGSFLIEAFDVLDRWLAQYEPDVAATERRRRILTENIYGVDLDDQAVEVTRLNLLLRASLERGRLPLLTNIQCGNSLIDDMTVVGDAAFKWEERFADVMRGGGFDVVIGNPPYLNMIQLDKSMPPGSKDFLKRRFRSASGGFDIYVVFIEKGVQVLKERGLLSFIVPNKFLAAEYAIEFRNWIHQNVYFQELVDYSTARVFAASVYPVIALFQKTKPTNDALLQVYRSSTTLDGASLVHVASPSYSDLSRTPDLIWSFITEPTANLLFKILDHNVPLEALTTIFGATTVAEGAEYVGNLVEERVLKQDQTPHAPFLVSGSIDRYALKWEYEPIQFTHRKYTRPHLLLRPPVPHRRIEQTSKEKLIVSKVGREPQVYWDRTGYASAFTTLIFDSKFSLGYLAGILNSKLMKYIYHSLFGSLAMAGGYLRFQPPQMKRLPIRPINFDDPADKARHDRMVEMVEQMIALKQEHAEQTAVFNDDRHELAQRIERLDRDIDALVYELYGLTDEEIAIVEGRG